LLEQPFFPDFLPEIYQTAQHIRNSFKDMVVLGIGGSTLNPQAILGLLPYQDSAKNSTRVHFIDTIDPHTIEGRLAGLDLAQTAFLATSKSGKTVETLAQTLLCLTVLKARGISDIGRRFFMISDPIDNPLRQLGNEIGATILTHPKDIGGRYSSLTNVGLLPAAVAGLNVEAIIQGSRIFLEHMHADEAGYAVEGAAIAYLMMKTKPMNVMMPYVNRLVPFTTWYRQIWAESLGKNSQGSTPIKAVGTLDQHSQLQLYLEGPKDKYFTLITLQNFASEHALDYPINHPSIHYLQHKTLGDINAASQQATADTLVKNGCPLRQISLKTLDELSMGALLMHFMLETILTASLMGVNAFDQPAVEQGKALARKILSQEKKPVIQAVANDQLYREPL
jgi:glucose-6-phosphate isomerase